MAIAKRIFLFLVINALVIVTISLVLNLFNVRPYLQPYGIDYQTLLIFCLIWGMGGAFISLALSRVMAKWMMGVKLINPNTHDPEERQVIDTVYALAKDANLKVMPEVGIYESPEVNAFATGPTKRRALVAVSRGLLRRMGQKEIEGVLAHEISHITNGDMVTMTLIQGIVNAFVMFLARILASVVSGFGRNREGNGGSYMSYMILVFVFEIIFMLLGSLVIAGFSRFREYRADAGGARLAGKDRMIAALEALRDGGRIYDQRADKPSLAAMKIGASPKKSFLDLLASHPPIEERIKRLRSAAP